MSFSYFFSVLLVLIFFISPVQAANVWSTVDVPQGAKFVDLSVPVEFSNRGSAVLVDPTGKSENYSVGSDRDKVKLFKTPAEFRESPEVGDLYEFVHPLMNPQAGMWLLKLNISEISKPSQIVFNIQQIDRFHTDIRTTRKFGLVGQKQTIIIQAMDGDQFVKNVNPILKITPPDSGQITEYTMVAEVGPTPDSWEYKGFFTPTQPGIYRADVIVPFTGYDGRKISHMSNMNITVREVTSDVGQKTMPGAK